MATVTLSTDQRPELEIILKPEQVPEELVKESNLHYHGVSWVQVETPEFGPIYLRPGENTNAKALLMFFAFPKQQGGCDFDRLKVALQGMGEQLRKKAEPGEANKIYFLPAGKKLLQELANTLASPHTSYAPVYG